MLCYKKLFTKLFQRKSDKFLELCLKSLRNIPPPSVSEMQNEILKKTLTIEELKNSIKTHKTEKVQKMTDYPVSPTLYSGQIFHNISLIV